MSDNVAADSASVQPSSSSTGMRPIGLIARNSGDCIDPPSGGSTGRSWPLMRAAISTRWTNGDAIEP